MEKSAGKIVNEFAFSPALICVSSLANSLFAVYLYKGNSVLKLGLILSQME